MCIRDSLCPDQDAIVQAAAPADYRPEAAADHKIKKTGADGLTLRMVENPDVAAMVGENKREDQVVVAFAAETEDLKANAAKKLEKKRADFIVGNDVTRPGAGFDVATNIVTFYDRQGETALPLLQKTEVADRILDRVARLLREKQDT